MKQKKPGELMLSEIREQPQAITRLIEAEEKRLWRLAARWHDNPPPFICIAARGTSDHAAVYGKYLFEIVCGIPVALAGPSVASIYKKDLALKDALVVGISQSGEAADVAAFVEAAGKNGADTLAITNFELSPLAAAASDVIPLHAGAEKAVAATKTFTTSMAALLLLAAAMGRNSRLLKDLMRVPSLMQEAIRQTEANRASVERFRYLRECVVLGRSFNLSIALELALKLRETSYLRAQPFASPDFLHGPIAIVREGYPVVAVANRGEALASVLEVIKEVRSRGAEAVVIGNAPEALDIADIKFPVNTNKKVPEAVSPFASIAAGQLFAQALAVIKGFDPDQPEGIRKVTVTM